jgi:hypothetical protein
MNLIQRIAGEASGLRAAARVVSSRQETSMTTG